MWEAEGDRTVDNIFRGSGKTSATYRPSDLVKSLPSLVIGCLRRALGE